MNTACNPRGKYFTTTTLILFILLSLIVQPANAKTIYGVGRSPKQGIYQVDLDNLTATLHFETPAMVWLGASDGIDENSFFATGDGGSLYQIDVINKTVTAVGLYGQPKINGLAYNEFEQVLYGTDYDRLYQINTSTAQTTEIGPFGLAYGAWAMDYDNQNNKLYLVCRRYHGNNEEQALYEVDAATGIAAVIGDTGQERITDIWCASQTGEIFGVIKYDSGGTGNICKIDKTNGSVTILAQIQEDLLGLGCPTPEPASITLFGFGLIGLRKVVRKHRSN